MRERLARVDGRILIALFILAIFAFALLETQRMSPRARLFPFATAIPGVAIALLALLREIRTPRPAIPAESATTLRALALFLAYFAGILIFGFIATTALFTTLYLWKEAELPWWGATIGAVVATGGILIFSSALHVPLPEGILRGLFPV